MPKKTYSCGAKTAKRILDAALRLFAEQGYHDTTLTNIAEYADVSTGTLYRYFPSKGDFLLESVGESLDDLAAFARELPEDMPVDEALVAVMMQDIKNTAKQFEAMDRRNALEELGESGNIGSFLPSNVTLAYSRAMYASPEHFERERAVRAKSIGVYESVVDRGKASGQLASDLNSHLMAKLILSFYLSEFDNGIGQSDYPYESKFKEGISLLFEGRLNAIG